MSQEQPQPGSGGLPPYGQPTTPGPGPGYPPSAGSYLPPGAHAYPYGGGYPQVTGGKDWVVALLLCIFLGVFGAHQFYTGKIGTGIVQLLTFGGCGIWALVDLIMIITGEFTDVNGQRLVRR